MSLLSQLQESINPPTERAFATIVGQRDADTVVAETPAGTIILLNGTLETGKKCFYDRRNSTILSEAPDLIYREFGV